MLHFDKPPEQNVTKLIDFGAQVGSRTHDVPSTGLVMRALLGWCCGTKGSSLREASHSSKSVETFVYSESGVAVPISKPAHDLINRFAAAERDSSFTAQKALSHPWFAKARKGEVPRRKAKPQRSKEPKKEGKKLPRALSAERLPKEGTREKKERRELSCKALGGLQKA